MSKERLFVVKIGGNVVDDQKLLCSFLKKFSAVDGKKVLIHGGGKIATEVSKSLGVEVKMVEGRRITDEDTLRIVTMVYGGWVNKRVVSLLQSLNCNAIGLTGADGNLIRAHKRPVKNNIDYGFVGDIDEINTNLLLNLVLTNLSPVIAPITHDQQGNLLNTNADTMASAIALAFANSFDVHLIYCFEKKGVLLDINKEDSLIENLSYQNYEKFKSEGVIADGMIPKLDNSFKAIKEGVGSLTIGHAMYLEDIIAQKAGSGTQLSF